MEIKNKKHIIWGIVGIVVLAAVAGLIWFYARGQVGPAPETYQNLENFSLKIGQEKKIGNVTINFVDVVSDNRCPQNTLCIVAGEAKARLSIHVEGYDPILLEYTLSGGTSYQEPTEKNTIITAEQRIAFAGLAPFPKSGKQPDKKDYEATFFVLK